MNRRSQTGCMLAGVDCPMLLPKGTRTAVNRCSCSWTVYNPQRAPLVQRPNSTGRMIMSVIDAPEQWNAHSAALPDDASSPSMPTMEIARIRSESGPFLLCREVTFFGRSSMTTRTPAHGALGMPAK